jgi:hypothetical protein
MKIIKYESWRFGVLVTRSRFLDKNVISDRIGEQWHPEPSPIVPVSD